MYADDCLILCNKEKDIQIIINSMKIYLLNIDLKLNENKTVIFQRFHKKCVKYLEINLRWFWSLIDHIDYLRNMIDKRVIDLKSFWKGWNINIIGKIDI